MENVDAIVVGAGPNGLAAAITLAQAGRSVLVQEAKDTIGGGCRTAELTLPGFKHDVCSSVYGLGLASPFFQQLPLEEKGLHWVYSPAALAHPFDDGSAALLKRSTAETGETLGADRVAYQKLIDPLVAQVKLILEDSLGPLPLPPKHPLALLRASLKFIRPASGLARGSFRGERARALFAGICAHSVLPLEAPMSAASGLILGMVAHVVGWPVAQGGSQRIIDAMACLLEELGGEIVTSRPVTTLDGLPPHRAVLFDTTPRQLVQIAGDRLPAGYRRSLGRFRYGPGAFKLDFALSDPIPWKASECSQAITVHLGGTLDEIAASERLVSQGEVSERPFVLLVQSSLFDPSRAPQGKHTAWAYCHVPNGSTVDMTERIIAQIERFAPGFRDCILAYNTITPAAMQAYNPNYIGGDIIGGIQDIWQQFTRPVISLNPYKTPAKGIYLCSSSTPPGGGVHGMCGYNAAKVYLHDTKDRD
jgi:phytoene dehydrogenase-like protein